MMLAKYLMNLSFGQRVTLALAVILLCPVGLSQPDFDIPDDTYEFPTDGGGDDYEIDEDSDIDGGGFLDDVTGIYNDGKDLFDEGKGLYDEIKGVVEPIIGIASDLYGLIDEFSVNGLADFACSTSVRVESIGSEDNEDDDEGDEGEDNEDGDSVGSVLCEVADGLDKLESTLADANKTIFSKADTIFGDLVSSGYIRVSSGDQAEISGLITEFEDLLNEVSDPVDEDGNPISRIEAIYEKGKDVVDRARAIAITDTKNKNPFNPGAVADNTYSILERSAIQEYGIKSKVAQVASQDLSNSSLHFTGETERSYEGWVKEAEGSQVEQTYSVSTRATLSPLIDTLNSTMIANGMAQIQMHKQFNVLAEQGVYTVSQLSILTESTLRQERDRLEQEEARENYQRRLSERDIEKLEQFTNGIAGVFEIAADPSLRISPSSADEENSEAEPDEL